jgi:hypothetical protein
MRTLVVWFSAILVLLTAAPSSKHLEILAKFLQTGETVK